MMESEEIIEKIDIIKNNIRDLYEYGVIKPSEYNDIWAKIDQIKINVKCKSED